MNYSHPLCLNTMNSIHKSFYLKDNVWDSVYDIVDSRVRLGTQNKISKVVRHQTEDIITFEVKKTISDYLREPGYNTQR